MSNTSIPGAHAGEMADFSQTMNASQASKMSAYTNNTEDMSIDPSSAPPTIPLEPDYFSPRIPEPGRKPWAIPVIIMVITAVLAVTIPVVVLVGKEEEHYENNVARHTPPPLPGKKGLTLEELNLLVPGLGEDTLERIKADKLSPQALALDWVKGDPYDWEGYEDSRKLQRYVLSVIFYALGGIGWGEARNLRWNKHHIHECDYNDNGRPTRMQLCDNQEQVVAIDLSKLDTLRGSLPPEIALLPHLHMIDFSMSTGGRDIDFLFQELLAVDRDLSRFFPSLYMIDLSDAEIDGTLPASLGTITSLEHLLIAKNNGLQGSIPTEFGQLSQLQLLSLSENSLTGDIPSELGPLPQLNEFFVNGNNLNEQNVPTSFCQERPNEWKTLITDWCEGVDNCCELRKEKKTKKPREEATNSPTTSTTEETTPAETPTEDEFGTTLQILDEIVSEELQNMTATLP